MHPPPASPAFAVVFAHESPVRVDRLSAFDKKKGHKVPVRDDAYTRTFIDRLTADTLREETEQAFGELRAQFAYKRRDITVGTDAGISTLSTPDFDYQLSIQLDPTDPSFVLLRRELNRVRDESLLQSPAFHTVFAAVFSVIEFRFPAPVAVADFVDRAEETQEHGWTVDYDSGCTWCRLTLPNRYRIHLTAAMLTITAPAQARLLDLLGAFKVVHAEVLAASNTTPTRSTPP